MGLQSIKAYREAAANMTKEEFLRHCPCPVLLVEPFIGTDTTGFGTLILVIDPKTGLPRSEEHKVARVAKSPGANAFADMITIGRAGNNDIVIRYATISKFHAYIREDAAGKHTLTDAGSTNGTFVDGKRLSPREDQAALAAGIEIKLHDLSMLYYSNGAFYDYLGRPG